MNYRDRSGGGLGYNESKLNTRRYKNHDYMKYRAKKAIEGSKRKRRLMDYLQGQG